MLSGIADDKLKYLLMDIVNLLFNGDLLLPVREILYEERLIALQKEMAAYDPIAVEYALRCVTAKCANAFIIK